MNNQCYQSLNFQPVTNIEVKDLSYKSTNIAVTASSTESTRSSSTNQERNPSQSQNSSCIGETEKVKVFKKVRFFDTNLNNARLDIPPQNSFRATGRFVRKAHQLFANDILKVSFDPKCHPNYKGSECIRRRQVKQQISNSQYQFFSQNNTSSTNKGYHTPDFGCSETTDTTPNTTLNTTPEKKKEYIYLNPLNNHEFSKTKEFKIKPNYPIAGIARLTSRRQYGHWDGSNQISNKNPINTSSKPLVANRPVTVGSLLLGELQNINNEKPKLQIIRQDQIKRANDSSKNIQIRKIKINNGNAKQ